MGGGGWRDPQDGIGALRQGRNQNCLPTTAEPREKVAMCQPGRGPSPGTHHAGTPNCEKEVSLV